MAGQQTVLQLQPFELSDAALGSQIDSFGVCKFREQLGDHLTALGQAKSGELHHEPAVVAIHGHAGQAVALAKHKPAGPIWTVQTKNWAAQMQRGLQTRAEKTAFELLI